MDWVRIFSTQTEARQRITENKPQLVVVDGKRICLVLRQNSFFAVADRCTHNGESLSKGLVTHLGDVVCPWHGYRFNLKTGREAAQQSADLETYPVREDDTGVYIGL